MSSPKVVLVTGCSEGGIGASMSEEFAKRGCKVYATARNVDKLGNLSPTIQKLALSVNSEQTVAQTVNTILEREGRIDILVNCATAGCVGPLLDLPLDSVQSVYDTNVFGILRMVQAVVPHMAKRGSGMVINVGSIAGHIAQPWGGAYSASKSSVHSLTDTLDMELRPFGIHVMLLAPGAVQSNSAANDRALGDTSGSLYAAFRGRVDARAAVTTNAPSMPTEEFARITVQAALGQHPPRYMSVGSRSWQTAILRWLPRWLVLPLIWWYFSLMY